MNVAIMERLVTIGLLLPFRDDNKITVPFITGLNNHAQKRLLGGDIIVIPKDVFFPVRFLYLVVIT